MSRELLAFLLSELSTVRIVCQGKKQGRPCGSVIELPLTELKLLFHKLNACPMCGSSFGVFPTSSGGIAKDGFAPLVEAIENLKSVGSHFQLEFVLPQED